MANHMIGGTSWSGTVPASRKFREHWEIVDNEVQVNTAAAIAQVQQEIRDETGRRIELIAKQWEQRNLMARASVLLEIGTSNWTVDEQDEWDAGKAIWDDIQALRTKSGELEALVTAETLDDDWTDDALWVIS